MKLKAALLFVGAIFATGLIGCGSGNSSPSTSTAVNNSVALTAGANGGIVNGLFTTVSVCQHGTTTCATIPNVEVDTGSVGLRLLPSAIGSLTLTPISVSNAPLEECIQYGDTSYSWVPMELADVQISGERALNIPVQILGQESAPAPSASSPASNGAYCLTSTPNPSLPGTPPGNEDTLAALGANGILGIGSFVVDCGSSCSSVFKQGYPYYICPNGTCQGVAVSTAEQAENPIAAFITADNNGVVITLPGVPAAGSGPISGTMTFGIGTRTNNNLGSANILALDQCGDLPTVTFHNATYSDTACSQSGSTALGGFLDTGSNALYVSDAGTLASEGIPISDCVQGTAGFNFYCVTGGVTATLSNVSLFGYLGVGSATISLNINDATTLFKTNNTVFNDLGADSVSGGNPSSDFFDLGMPFFLGRTVFVGIAGQSTPVGISAPNGFVAF